MRLATTCVSVLLLLSACGTSVTPSPVASPSPSHVAQVSGSATESASAGPTVTPLSLEHQATLMLAELAGGACSFTGGDVNVLPRDLAAADASIEALDDGHGWLEEGWLWAGPLDAAVDGFEAELLVADAKEAWIHVNGDGFHGLQLRHFVTPAGHDLWQAANTLQAHLGDCPLPSASNAP